MTSSVSCVPMVRYNEPMAEHCTFKVGGPADCWIQPSGEGSPAYIASVLMHARDEQTPVFVLGGGANILVSDAGIRGIVLDTGAWTGVAEQPHRKNVLRFRSGTSLDDAAETAAAAGLSGLEFLAGMPGSIGGAVWMNARAYGHEIAGVLIETEVIDCTGTSPVHARLPARQNEFGYKSSPFQGGEMVILTASFQLSGENPEKIRAMMRAHRDDRTAKGQYRSPSAGSVFKNDSNFGKPSGQIIDELGLRGLRIGGAQVAPWHGNIIINTGEAAAADIRALVREVSDRVLAATGFKLEPEILFAGEWTY